MNTATYYSPAPDHQHAWMWLRDNTYACNVCLSKITRQRLFDDLTVSVRASEMAPLPEEKEKRTILTCSYCGVSEYGETGTCPHCGAPRERKRESGEWNAQNVAEALMYSDAVVRSATQRFQELADSANEAGDSLTRWRTSFS